MSFIFHVLCTLIFTRVWLWHFTPEAAELPGSKGFGWFFRYLTFCSYTLQMALFVISCLCQLVGVRMVWRIGRGAVLRSPHRKVHTILHGLSHSGTRCRSPRPGGGWRGPATGWHAPSSRLPAPCL